MIVMKQGARSSGIRPEVLLALITANEVYAKRGVDLVVTSVTDGKHSRGSLHYIGAAVDLRTRSLPGGAGGSVAQEVGNELRQALGEDFDVVVESDHIHLEFQPKRGMNLPA